MFSTNEYIEMKEELEAEAARLREELQKAVACVVALQTAHESLLATERAAHEGALAVVKEDAERHIGRCYAAEARVAELERELEQERAEVEMKQAALDGSTRTWREQKTALDQARGLLDEWLTTPGAAHTPARLLKRVNDWLRAHPATAAPAATGADSFTTRHGDVIDISEKEQGT